MKTIRVTGKANLRVVPEQTKVNLTVRGFAMKYSEALEQSVRDMKVIKDTLESCGIDREALKTEDFYTSEKTKQVKDQYGNTSYRHIGYDVTHRFNFRFDNDNKLLGKVLYELSRLSINPRIDVTYVLKDSEKYKDELITLAVKDALRKAKVMASAGEVELGDIKNMDYSYHTISWESRQYISMECDIKYNAAATFDIDMNPEDASLSDTVTIEWEIK